MAQPLLLSTILDAPGRQAQEERPDDGIKPGVLGSPV
jgi:hypothetical protein